MILNTSDKAAEYRENISGWVSSTGRFWGYDEQMARWDGCTHVCCKNCNAPTNKRYLICPKCREKNDKNVYKKRKTKIWQDDVMVYSDFLDKFFRDKEDVLDFCEENGYNIKDLRLLICEPLYAKEIDPNDYYWDDLPEDLDEVPQGVQEAFDVLNETIAGNFILSYIPTKYAVKLDEKGGF